jgi:ABC-2 type transport system permease protein
MMMTIERNRTHRRVPGSVVPLARLVWVGWLFRVKEMTRSALFVFTAVIEPLIFATLTYYLFSAGSKPETIFYSALGAGMMGIWSTTLFASGGAVQWQRWQGTLELLVAAPSRFLLVIFPLTLGSATIGLYALVATLAWERLLFGLPFDPVHPVLFVVSVPTMIFGLGVLGLLIATSFVLYRNANALSNMLEFPVWLATGVIVPLSLLPGWTQGIGWTLAPTWGFRAVRRSVFGGDVWPCIGMSLALAAVYFALAAACAAVFERRARERATLSLT